MWRILMVIMASHALGAVALACTIRLPLFNVALPIAPGQRHGLDLDIAEAIMAEAGCKLILSDGVSRSRRDVLLAQGQVDMVLAASDTPERQAIGRFSTAYRTEEVRLFSLPDQRARYDSIKSFDDIVRHKVRLLVPNGGWYGADYANAESTLKENGQLSTFKSFDNGLTMLEAGRGAIIMGDFLRVQRSAEKLGMRIAPLSFVVLRAPVHLMFSRMSMNAQDVQRIDAAIARLEARGVLKLIRHKYCEVCDLE